MAYQNYQITLKTRDDLASLYDTVMDEILPSFIERVQELYRTGNHIMETLYVYLFIPDVSELANVSPTLDLFLQGESGSDEPLFEFSCNIEPRRGGPYGQIDYDLMFENNLSIPTAGIKQVRYTTYVGNKYSDADFVDLVDEVVSKITKYLNKEWQYALTELENELMDHED